MSEEGTTNSENVAENEVVADSASTAAAAATSSSPTSPTADENAEESTPVNPQNTEDVSTESEKQAHELELEPQPAPDSEPEPEPEQEQPDSPANAFDSLKDTAATTPAETDTTDNGTTAATIDEPMEVDEEPVDDAENSQDANTSIGNEDAQKDADEQKEQQQEVEPNADQPESHDQANDSSELDGSHSKEAQHGDNETETTQMEVDCETPQGEDVPDRGVTATQPSSDELTAGGDESNAGSTLKSGDDDESRSAANESTAQDDSKVVDDSVMEHNVEQFNCSNMSDTSQKDQTASNDDPFDSLMRNDGNSMSEQQQQKTYDENNRSNAASSLGEPIEADLEQNDDDDDGGGGDGDGDGGGGSDRDDDMDNDDDDNVDDEDAGDSNSHHDGSAHEAVDDIEEGKGADEELCLLPDEEEREISDADRERAMQNQQQVADENDENEENENEIESDANDANLEAIEQNGEKDAADDAQEDNEMMQDAGEQTQSEPTTGALGSDATEAVSASVTPSAGEIKEIDSMDAMDEKVCIECGQMIKCKFSLLREIFVPAPAPADDDPEAATAAAAESTQTEIQYLCDTACVTKFNEANTQYKVVVKKVAIFYAMDTEQPCHSCSETKSCKYRFKEPSDAEQFTYICEEECLNRFFDAHPDRYVLAKKRFIVEEVSASAADADTENKCLQCLEDAKCKYTFKEDDQPYYLCTEPCLNLLMAEQPDRFRFKRQSIRVKDLSRKPSDSLLTATSRSEASSTVTPKRASAASAQEKSKKMVARTEDQQRIAALDREASFSRRCAQCYSDIMLLESNLQWETMDFCNESCLGQYQQAVGAACQTCQNAVSVASMGKYCVRFGFELRQFCRSACLDAFKKGLKVCSYCQIDIKKNDEFLAPINGQFKDFCSKKCMKCYEQIFNHKKHVVKQCAVCNNQKNVRVEIIIDAGTHYFCSNPCFSAFSFVNNVNPDCCSMCRKYFERRSSNAHTIYQGNETKVFCTKICMNIYIIANREIAPCQWCKVRKYNFDMIQKTSANGGQMMLCSINCLSMCEVSMNAIAMKQQKCDQCNSMTTPQYHLTMSDASMRNFCTYQCVMSFQGQFSRAPLTLDGEVAASGDGGAATNNRSQPVPTGLPKRIKSTQLLQQQQNRQQQSKSQGKGKSTPATRGKNTYQAAKQASSASNNLVISSVTSLASSTRSTRRSGQAQSNDLGRLQPVVELEPLPDRVVIEKTTRPVGRPRNTPIASEPASKTTASAASAAAAAPQVRIEKQTQIVTVPPLPKKVANAATLCAPSTHNKEIQARPMQFTVGCQTDSYLERKMVIPIPVPIYLPTPLPMYAQPFPVPIPMPLPIPVPVFIPTTRNSANGIMKEIKKIQDKMPADPFEAELLMMAEMVAGDKKKEEETDSSEEENDYQQPAQQQHHHHQSHHDEMGSNNFGEDIMQMALKMATEYDPTAVDLEASMQANTITPHSHPGMGGHDVMQNHHMMMMSDDHQRPQRKRGPTPRGQQHQQQQQQQQQRQAAKRQRRGGVMQEPPPPEPPREPVEKADANMCLKFTFGVNAWKQWVMTKNAELEKSSVRRKLFKTELLQLTADELNYSLCLFVKEVRKPNGSEYAPDTIYYLVLGIQEYLYENGRIDNIFTDPYYERFTDCLDEVAKKFSVLYNDSQYIVTRVEEEHLWECKQLGAHSPHVLLSTLMFFNTKHFNLTTVEEHMQLSFSHIMKHWKRNPNQGSGKVAGSRNVLLRFYPPQSSHIDNSRKKKVYEQQENEENPLRCPVKLYEFYLSKCPESVKTRNDVFYLLPERSCVPDSPVWYSTQALGKEALSKMLHRVKMVKEINIALLTS